MATTASKSSAPVASKTTAPSAAVKATQIALNNAGANLKVDGISGPLTQAAMAKYGTTAGSSPSVVSSGNSVAPKAVVKPTVVVPQARSGGSSGQTNYSTPSKTTKSSMFANPFDGGFINNFKSGWSDAINTAKTLVSSQPASAVLSAKTIPGYTDASGVYHSTVINPYNVMETPSFTSKITGGPLQAPVVGTAEKPIVANNQPTALDAQGNYYTTTGGPVSNPNGTPMTTQNVQNTSTNSNLPTTVQSKTVTTDPSTGAVNTLTSTAPVAPTTPPVVNNPVNTSTVIGLTDNFTKSVVDPFTHPSNVPEFQNNETLKYQDGVSKIFNTPIQVDTAFANDPAFNSAIIKASTKANITPAEMINQIKSKVITATNGIQAPQTTAEYLAKNKLIDSSVTKALNEQLASDYNFTQQQKDLYLGSDKIKGMLQQQRDESTAMIELLKTRELARETSEKDKAQFEIDKAKAEYDAASADLELNRQVAKDNLTNFLAHIGALNTDGAAGVGLANLEQKYQAQKAALTSKWQLASREINLGLNDHLNELQNNRDEAVLKLNMDLSKTDREINMKVMELDHNLQKDTIAAKLKYAEMIQTASEKAKAKAETLAKDWTSSFLTITGGDFFKSLPKEFQTTWMTNNQAGIQKGNKTDQVQLMNDYINWNKSNANNIKMTTAEEYKLQQQGVDVNAYKTNEEYRNYVNSNLSN